MSYKDVFFELKKAMLLLKKRHAFEKFNSMNFFLLADERSKGIVVFNNQSLEDALTLSMYFGDSGLNYLVDSYTSTSGLLHNAIFADMIIVSLLQKRDLVEEDLNFFKKHKIRVYQENNLVACEFKEGYEIQYLSLAKLKRVITYIYYLISIIDNELEDIENCFKEEKLVLTGFDTKNYLYEIKYTQDFTLSSMPVLKKIDYTFIEEYKDTMYVDDICYIGRYFDLIKEGSQLYHDTIFIANYEKNGNHIMEKVSCKPHQFLEYCKGFLDSLFKEYGVPTRIVLNHRLLFAYLFKTLKELNIEVDFQREPAPLDAIFLDYISQAIEEEEGEKKIDVFVS